MNVSPKWSVRFRIQDSSLLLYVLQGSSGGKVNVLGGDSFGHCEEKVRINMCLVPNGYWDRAVWIYRPNSFRFFLCGWIMSEVYKINVLTQNEFLFHILDAAACIKEREDQLRRTTRDFAHEKQSVLSLTVGFSTFIVNCNKFVIYV
jgi:hypothetical protein